MSVQRDRSWHFLGALANRSALFWGIALVAKAKKKLVATSAVLGCSAMHSAKLVDASGGVPMVASNEKQGSQQQPHIE